MAALSEIIAAARAAAKRALKPTDVVDVQVAPDVGFDGDDTLRITIVVPDADFDTIDGDSFLEAISQIGEALEKLGDPRFAVVSYITPSEMASLGDAQS